MSYEPKKNYSHLLHCAMEDYGYESQTQPIFQDKFNGKQHFIAGFNACWDLFSKGKYTLDKIPESLTEKDVYGQTHE